MRIPSHVIDAAGRPVDLTQKIWRLNEVTRHLTVDWEQLEDAPPDACFALKLYIVDLIKRRSPSHVFNTFSRVRNYLVALRSSRAPGAEVSTASLLWYLGRLRARKSEYLFHNIRAWYEWSTHRELVGFDDSTLATIVDHRVGGNVKGVAVLSADPEQGPLDEFEEAAIRAALHRDRGPIAERTLVWLLLAFGLNPANAALLDERDFREIFVSDDLPRYYELKIPRIKKRVSARGEFKPRKLDDHLASLVKELVDSNRGVAIDESFDRPLFRKAVPRRLRLNGPMHRFAFFHTAYELTELAQECVRRLNVVSPRTGKPLRVTVRRLRYTFACKMVRQGASAAELADLLDHTDLQNVMVYFKSSSEAVKHLDRALAEQMGPMVRAFLGQITGSEREADKSSRITTIDLLEAADIGRCGASFDCRLAPPVTCYTCDRFEAFNDGPHEKMLDAMIERREAHLTAGRERIAAQLDDVILAMGEIVAKMRAS